MPSRRAAPIACPKFRFARFSTCDCIALRRSAATRSVTSSRNSRSRSPKYLAILADRVKLYAVMREELVAVRAFATPRLSEIVAAADGIDDEDLIDTRTTWS